ncbi:MAG: tRNA-dihydrouridine synthase [Candidatus Magasanikbacteria bacterium]
MWYKQNKKPILALAPMADMTDWPFCQICRKVSGEDFVIFREMVSSEAIVRTNEKTLKMCEFDSNERPIIQQIFGAYPEVVLKAAELIVKNYKPDGIDVNMGCPVPKIAGKADCGAALLKDPERAVNIVKALKKANLGVTISVKTRLGWTDNDDILKFAPMLEEAGIDFISIHGRTRQEGYTGIADWVKIAQVKKLVSIPVFANGDIKNQSDIKRCLEITGADGVMIGRGALGNPWIFAGIDKEDIPLEELKKIVIEHAKLHIEHYGEKAITTFRKHLAYYFKGIPGMKDIRSELVRVVNIEELENIIKKIPN